MKLKALLIAGVVMIPVVLAASTAEAGHKPYCRSFTKSIRIGGDIEAGYGRACLQPDGAWQIVASGGTVNPFYDDHDRRDHDSKKHKRKKHHKKHRVKYERSYHSYDYDPYYNHVEYYTPRKHYKRHHKNTYKRAKHRHNNHCGHYYGH